MSVIEPLAEQYRALLEVSESIAAHHDLPDVFRALAQRLPRVLKFSSMVLGLHDPSKNVMRLQALENLRPMPVSPDLEAVVIHGNFVLDLCGYALFPKLDHESTSIDTLQEPGSKSLMHLNDAPNNSFCEFIIVV